MRTGVADDEADIRVRLEGRVELVERALLPYRQLTDALRSPWWRTHLQKRAASISHLVGQYGDFEAALEAMQRQSSREPWPASLLEVLRELTRLHDELNLLSARRVPGDGLGPRQRLARLLEGVLTAKRFIVPGWELRVAAELLPSPSFELDAMTAFAQVLTLSLEEIAGHDESWREGNAALEVLLARLRRVDPSHRLVSALQREALRRHSSVNDMLPGPGGDDEGLTVLLRTLALRSQFELAADAFLTPRIGLAAFHDDERFALLRWLQAPELPLKGLTESRAALIRLGHALSALPKDRTLWPWEQLITLAARADALAHSSSDWAQLRDLVQVLAKALNPNGPRCSFESLTDAVQALRVA